MTTPPRFMVDANVGRLAGWLRALGYDALFNPDIADNDLIRIAYKENRVVLSRDAHLAQRRLITTGQLRLVLLRDDDPKEQMRQLVRDLGLSFNLPFTRCLRCNTPLGQLARATAQSRVPPYVYQTQEEFMECAQCRRVYWRGTHWHNMKRDLLEVLEGVL